MIARTINSDLGAVLSVWPASVLAQRARLPVAWVVAIVGGETVCYDTPTADAIRRMAALVGFSGEVFS